MHRSLRLIASAPQGIKWYGIHLGAPKTPFRESDTRHLPPQVLYSTLYQKPPLHPCIYAGLLLPRLEAACLTCKCCLICQYQLVTELTASI